jgi:hypothetical protein
MSSILITPSLIPRSNAFFVRVEDEEHFRIDKKVLDNPDKKNQKYLLTFSGKSDKVFED